MVVGNKYFIRHSLPLGVLAMQKRIVLLLPVDAQEGYLVGGAISNKSPFTPEEETRSIIGLACL